jgi:hypothetical protein
MITIVSNMPTYRPSPNWLVIKRNYWEMIQNKPADVQFFWQPILYTEEVFKFGAYMDLLSEPWISPLIVERTEGVRPEIDKTNKGIEHLKGNDLFIHNTSDDNIFPVDTLKVIGDAARGGKKVVVVSHKRGQRTQFHGHSDLIADPRFVYPSYISGEQYLVHGTLMENYRYNPERGIAADGFLIQKIFQEHRGEFVFLPTFHLPFNAMQPKRWKRSKLFECTKSTAVNMIPDEVFIGEEEVCE